jgi:DNA-binding transcriptional LysR family regulator
MFRRIRVGVWALPNMLSSIVTRELSGSPEFSVQAVTSDRRTLSDVVADRQLDVVIVGSRAELDEDAIEEVLGTHPGVRILTLEDDGRQTFLWRMVPESRTLGEISPPEITATIRAIAGSGKASSSKRR